jgi:hypothetical protein
MKNAFWTLIVSSLIMLPASAGTLEINPDIQNAISIQNAQQIQLGFGVDRQEANLVQQQDQTQFHRERPQGYQREIPLNDDIRVNPSIQNAISVQNAQQIQLAIPNFWRSW